MKRLGSLAWMPLLCVAVGCPGPTVVPDGGSPPTGAPPKITGVTPPSVQKGQINPITITGDGFVSPVHLWLGTAEATGVTVVNAQKLLAETPADSPSGVVDVKVVNPDGQVAILPQSFSFIDHTPKPITYCNLQWPFTMMAVPGGTSPTVYGHVRIDGVTGQGTVPTGLTAQVGYGSQGTDPSSWTNWTSASFNATCSTCGGTDSEYQATFVVPPAGMYSYTYRFSQGGGVYTYCDKNGMTDGTATSGLGVLTANGSAGDGGH